jgi:hypothetical protein
MKRRPVCPKILYATGTRSRWAYAVVASAGPDLSHLCVWQWKAAYALPGSPAAARARGR